MTPTDAHRAAASALADRYFAEQCARLGPVDSHPSREHLARLSDEAGRRAATRETRRNVGLDRFRL